MESLHFDLVGKWGSVPAMFRLLLPLCCLSVLAACSDSRDVMAELPNSSVAGAPREAMTETRIESTLARAVTIGEDGPQLDACGAMGVVGGQGAGKALPLRSAPFEAARTIASLPDGARVHVCTRSLDQRWLGVVVMQPVVEPTSGNSSAQAPVDCGVSSPVDSKRPYAGPCRSGWLSSGFVQLIAG